MLSAPIRYLLVSTLGYAGTLAACDAGVPEDVSPPSLDCPDTLDTSKPPSCPPPPACETCETCSPPVACPPPDDRTPPGYMTCQEWLAVEPVLTRDPLVPPLCLDLTPRCDGSAPGWCAPGETTVLRRMPVGEEPTPPALPGCVETGDAACDQQALVDCCAWSADP